MLENFATIDCVLGKATPANQPLVGIAARIPVIEFTQVRLRICAKRPPPHFVSPLGRDLKGLPFLVRLPYAYGHTTARIIETKSNTRACESRSTFCSVSTGTH